MPSKTFTAGATFTSAAGQLLQTALSLTTTKTESFNKDSVQATYVVSASSEQVIYSTGETTTPLVYVFVQASTSNATGSANELALQYSSSAAVTSIGKLKPGDWAYLPYSGSNGTLLKVTNPGTTSGTVLVIFAESGSGD